VSNSLQTHVRAPTARERTTVLDAFGRQLLHEPRKETRKSEPGPGTSDLFRVAGPVLPTLSRKVALEKRRPPA
jgi:hypothetical protein